MVRLTNSVGTNINIIGINKTPQNAVSFKATKPQEDTAKVKELSPVTNDTMVKTPLKYTKTGEIELPYGLKAECFKFSNGQRVVIVPKEGETVLKTYVNTGSMNETDNIRGISHYIEHNLFNGSDGLEAGEFFQTTERMGAETNASTGLAETNYFIASHLLNDNDLENKIKIHASMIETPRFAIDMLEKEKGIVNSEINMITSDPGNIAYNTTLKNLFNIKSTSKDIIGGTTTNITNLTREDVVKYYEENYYPANMVTVVTGEVNSEDTMKLLAKYFSSNKKVPPQRYYEPLIPTNKPIRQDIISDKAESTIITLGFAGPQNNNTKDRIHAEALTRLMFKTSNAKQLFDEMNTSVGCFGEKVSGRPSDKRALIVEAETNEENSEKLLKAIYSQINKYQHKLPSQEEMDTIKRDLKRDFSQMFEYSYAVNNNIGEAVLEDNLGMLVDYEKIIDEMTPQDLTNVANKYFDLKKTAITVVHPANTTAEAINKNHDATKNISFTGAMKKQAVNLDNIKQYNVGNNYRVVMNDSKLPTGVFEAVLPTPYAVKSDNPAAYIALERILNSGTATMSKDELNDYKEKNGIDIKFRADINGFAVNAKFDQADTVKTLDIMKSVIETPNFDEKVFEDVKEKLTDDLKRTETTPWNALNPKLFKGYDFTKAELLKGLETLTLDDVKKLHTDLFKDTMATVTISAPFKDNPELKNDVFRKINEFKSVKPFKHIEIETFEPQEKAEVLVDTSNKSQAQIVTAYKFRNVGNLKDEVTIELLNTILGGGPSSRLFSDLREQQKLAYSVRSNLSSNGTTSSINLSIGTTTDNKETGEKSYDNLQKSINGFNYHIEKLKNEPVTQEELDSAKLSMKNMILSICEGTEERNCILNSGLHSNYGVSKENQYLEMIDKITVDDIYNAAQYIFSGKPLYSIVATENTLKYNENYLNKLL